MKREDKKEERKERRAEKVGSLSWNEFSKSRRGIGKEP